MISIVTGNAKKFAEMQAALTPFNIETEQVDIDIPEWQTMDHIRVVTEKARAAFERHQKPILVDDSGFYIEKYQQFPGVYSKDIYKMIGYDGLFALTKEGDRAAFHCYVGYMDATLKEPFIFHETNKGAITHDFDRTQAATEYAIMPYVPLFTPDIPGSHHRIKTLNAFAEWYQSR
jgi:non-canonical purine NTP pyrophosphatase (RdgB/HAM1 family)